MSSLRDLLAAALLVVATCIGCLCLPSDWLQRNVVDEDGFLAITQPLGEDRELQRSLSDLAVEDLLDQWWIPGIASDQVEPYAQDAAADATSSGAYQQMWDESMVEMHAGLFAPGDSELQVDLEPVLDAILESVEGQLPSGVDVPRPESAKVPLASIPDVPALRFVADYAAFGGWSWLPAVLLAAVALGIAAHRRAALVGVGVAGMIVGALSLLLGLGIGVLVPDSIDQLGFAAPVVRAFEEHLTGEMAPRAGIVLGAGALVVTAAVLALRLPRRG